MIKHFKFYWTGTAQYNTDIPCVGFHSSNIINVYVYMHASNMVSNLDVFFVVAVKQCDQKDVMATL